VKLLLWNWKTSQGHCEPLCLATLSDHAAIQSVRSLYLLNIRLHSRRSWLAGTLLLLLRRLPFKTGATTGSSGTVGLLLPLALLAHGRTHVFKDDMALGPSTILRPAL
jgi:hypothetical protein